LYVVKDDGFSLFSNVNLTSFERSSFSERFFLQISIHDFTLRDGLYLVTSSVISRRSYCTANSPSGPTSSGGAVWARVMSGSSKEGYTMNCEGAYMYEISGC